MRFFHALARMSIMFKLEKNTHTQLLHLKGRTKKPTQTAQMAENPLEFIIIKFHAISHTLCNYNAAAF